MIGVGRLRCQRQGAGCLSVPDFSASRSNPEAWFFTTLFARHPVGKPKRNSHLSSTTEQIPGALSKSELCYVISVFAVLWRNKISVAGLWISTATLEQPKLWTHPEGMKARVQKIHKKGLVGSTSLRQWPLGWAELSVKMISYSVAFNSWLSSLAFQISLLDDGPSLHITWTMLVLKHLCGSYSFVKTAGIMSSHRSLLELIWFRG